MSEAGAPAPSGIAAWTTMTVPAAGPWPPASLVLLPDAAGTGASFALLARPVLDRRPSGQPVLSLTLLLERQPQPWETDVTPLILSGTCTLQVLLSVPAELRAEAGRLSRGEVRPVYAREASMRLVARRAGAEKTIATAKASGTALRGAFAVTLTRDEVLELIGALDGGPSTLLRVDADVTFRAASQDSAVTITGYWAAVHDVLAEAARPATRLDVGAIERAFEDMIERRVIDVWADRGQLSRAAGLPVPEGAFQQFIRSAGPILRPAGAGVYELCRRPHPAYRFEITGSVSGGITRVAESRADMRSLLSGALAGFPREAFIKLVAPGSGPGLAETPRRVRQAPSRAASGSARAPMALAGDSIRAIAHEMRPSLVASQAAALANSELTALHSTSAAGHVMHWSVNDLVLQPTPGRIESLPIVSDPAAAIWRDRVRSEIVWYAPQLELTMPNPAADPQASPFAFTFRRHGATADGKPALLGTVRFRLRKTMSAATRAAMPSAAGTRAVQLPMQGLSVALSVPYINEADGSLRRTRLQGRVVEDGDALAVSVELLNDSVRLAYGALSTQGFQPEPARIHVAYSYRAWVPIRTDRLEVQLGGKIALTRLEQKRGADSRARVVGVSLSPGGPALTLVPEEPDAVRAASSRLAPRPGLAGVLASSAVMTPAVLHATQSGGGAASAVAALPLTAVSSPALAATPISPQVVVARPPLSGSTAIADLIRRVEYGQQTLLREERVDAFVSCERFGGLYREETDTGAVAVGCADALRLGQATVRLYREMTELAGDRFRVLRSLVQPGRFLVLPTTYRITRYSPALAEKAYRPAVAVYSSIDLARPENNRVIYHATLQPDIPVHLVRQLEQRLAAEAHDPVLEYPTEIASETEYAWSVDAAVRVEPRAVRMVDGFQVTLATDLAGALILKTMVQNTGVFGSARFRLGDGTALDTVLAFDLASIAGPWMVGPVAATIAGPDVQLRNMIETPVDVAEVIVQSAAGARTSLPVDATLQPAETRTVPAGTPAAAAWAACHPAPAGPADLEEIRSFLEEIHTNVVFVNLVHFANHGLTGVDIEARIKGVPGTRPVPMNGDPPRGTLDFLLPITTYLAQHVLQFRVLKTFSAAPPQHTPWIDWDLETSGNVVSLTWELIA